MRPNRKFLAVALILFGLLLSLGKSPVYGESPYPQNKVPGAVESKARRLMNTLKQQGYEVQRGYFKLYTVDDCPVSYAEIGSCFGNNPAAPYITFAVPPWPEEFVDPAIDTAFGLNLDGYSTTYRLDLREAIVILGVLPPPAAYFGLQTYQFSHQGAFVTESPTYQFMLDKPPLMRIFFTTVPQNPGRVQNFASLSNSINNVVIERQSGAAFDQLRYFILTPDQIMNTTVRGTLNNIWVADEDIFTEPIPANVNLGLDEAADDFITILRYAMPVDGGEAGAPSAAWRDELPLVVLRIRDTRPDRQPVAYPAFTAPEARPVASEFSLQADLTGLVQAVSQRWGQPAAAANAMRMLRVQHEPINMVGPKCSLIGMNCLGDTQDTSYQYSYPLPLGQNIVYAIAGTLGTRTNNATYVGLGLTSTFRMLGFDNRSDADLADSASDFAPVVNNTDKFFLYYLTRSCTGLDELTGGRCLEIAEADIPLCANPAAPTCDKLSISLRNYLPPGSQRGPDDNYILPAVVIPLQKPSGG